MDSQRDVSEIDGEARRYVYDRTMREGLPPTAEETAQSLALSTDEIRDSFKRLAGARVLVLQKESGEILMANPFSAVPTPFIVKANGRSFYGNCIWDSMGIPAMLKTDGVIEASCGCCGMAMNLRITNGSLEEAEGVAHFAVPAAHWWDDIVFN